MQDQHSQKTGHTSKVEKLKKEKTSRACYVCRQRKVKCDAAKTHPERCSNCVQFNIQNCVIPEPKKRKSKKIAEIMRDNKFLEMRSTTEESNTFSSSSESPPHAHVHYPSFVVPNLQKKYPEMKQIELSPSLLMQGIDSFAKNAENADWNCPYTEDVINTYIQQNLTASTSIVTIDQTDYDHIVSAGCLNLPREEICWKWINCFFANRQHQLPIILKKKFVEDYKDLRNPPSLLLLQSMLYAGARFYTEKEWTKEQKDEQMEMSDILYKRAKILFDKRIEPDTLCNLQSLMLLANYKSRNKLDVKVDCSYIKRSLDFCYSLRIHKNPDTLTDIDEDTKRLYKRIWWSLFSSDTLFSFIMGRPWAIDCINKSDVPMITARDLRDDINDSSSDESIETVFFIQRLKLVLCLRKICESCSRIIHSPNKSFEVLSSYLDQCDQMMRDWIEQLPTTALFRINSPSNNAFNATLSLEYYSALLLLHRVHILVNTSANNCRNYPSWGIVFKAAHMVAVISRYIMKNKLVSFTQNIIPFAMNISGLMMIYHLYNKDKTVHQLAKDDIETFLSLLYEASVDWPSTHMTYYSLKSIYESKAKQSAYVNFLLLHHHKLFRNPASTLTTDEKPVNDEGAINSSVTTKTPLPVPVSGSVSISPGSGRKATLTDAPANSIMYRHPGRLSEIMGYNSVVGPNTLNARNVSSNVVGNSIDIPSSATYCSITAPSQHQLLQNDIHTTNCGESPRKDSSFLPHVPSLNGLNINQHRNTQPVYRPLVATGTQNSLGRYNYPTMNVNNAAPPDFNNQKPFPNMYNGGMPNGYSFQPTMPSLVQSHEEAQTSKYHSPFVSPSMTPMNEHTSTFDYLKNLNNQSVVSEKFDLVMPPDSIPSLISSNWQPEFDMSLLNSQDVEKHNPSADFDYLLRILDSDRI